MMKKDKQALKDWDWELNKARAEIKKLKDDMKILQDKETTMNWNLESKESLIRDLRHQMEQMKI